MGVAFWWKERRMFVELLKEVSQREDYGPKNRFILSFAIRAKLSEAMCLA